MFWVAKIIRYLLDDTICILGNSAGHCMVNVERHSTICYSLISSKYGELGNRKMSARHIQMTIWPAEIDTQWNQTISNPGKKPGICCKSTNKEHRLSYHQLLECKNQLENGSQICSEMYFAFVVQWLL